MALTEPKPYQVDWSVAVPDAVTIDNTIKATAGAPIVTNSNTSITLALTDAGSYLRLPSDGSSAVTVTVPPNSSVAFSVGAEITIIQTSVAQVTFAAGSGVTINSKNSNLNLAGQYAAATLKKVATDEWDLIGDLEA